MTRGIGRCLAAGALLSALALPATAQDGMFMDLEVLEVEGQAWAFVLIEHALDLPIGLEVEYEVDGEVVKVEPVWGHGPFFLSEPLGSAQGRHVVCVTFGGDIQVSSDTYMPTEGERCGEWTPRPKKARTLGLKAGLRGPGLSLERPAPSPLSRPPAPRLTR